MNTLPKGLFVLIFMHAKKKVIEFAEIEMLLNVRGGPNLNSGKFYNFLKFEGKKT